MVSGPSGYGYRPPPPYHRKVLDTEKGVKHLNWAIVIYIVASLLAFLGLIVVAVLLQDVLTSTDPDAWAEVIGPLVGVVGLLCGAVVLLLVTLILGLLGLYEMYTGRNEFGEHHSTNVTRAVILVVLYIVLLVIGSTVAFAFVGYDIGLYDDPESLLDDMRASAVAASAVEIVADALFALALVLLVRELCDEKYRRILWAGFYIAIIATVVGHLISIGYLYAVDASGMTVDEVNQLSLLSSLAMGLSFIPFIFFFVCYRHAHARISSGEIQPHPGAFAAAMPQPYPVPPPYPQQPPYPPESGKVCPSCGNPSRPGEIFCANCGAKLG